MYLGAESQMSSRLSVDERNFSSRMSDVSQAKTRWVEATEKILENLRQERGPIPVFKFSDVVRKAHVRWKIQNWLRCAMLLFSLTLYTLLGAAIFSAIEIPAEQGLQETEMGKLEEQQRNFSTRLLTLFSAANCSEPEECVAMLMVELGEFELAQWETARHFRLSDKDYPWGFWSAAYYSVTIYTTIGYGNVMCRTVAGRAVTVIYALIGIPLMLATLNSCGKLILRGCQNLRSLILQFYDSKLKANRVKQDPGFSSPTIMHNKTFPLSLALILLAVHLLLSSAIMLLWEDWNYFESLYFEVISLFTIGLGDYVPKSPLTAALEYVLLVFGLALVSMCVTIFQESIEQRYVDALKKIEKSYSRVAAKKREFVAKKRFGAKSFSECGSEASGSVFQQQQN